MADASSPGSLEAEALRRKAKLEALRAKRGHDSENSKQDQSHKKQLPKPQFRSYAPLTPSLQSQVVDPAAPGDVDAHLEDAYEKEDETPVLEKLDFTNLAPRKVDWDLKRDVDPKLARLERKTQRAIAELIRERLHEQNKSDDLAAAVEASIQADQKDKDDDEDDE